MTHKQPCVYMMTNARNGTLYVGVTSNLPQRVQQHKSEAADGFTKKYQLHMLVYYEQVETMASAIEREKQIKAGSRKKKLALIEEQNPLWRDLSSKL